MSLEPFTSNSPEKTEAWGVALGKQLEAQDVLALTGPIGAGKTTLVRGLAEGLGAKPNTVASPSFVLVRVYRGRIPIVHADLFRLEGMPEAATVGLEEFFDADGVTVIEWANRIPEILPSAYLEIQFEVIDPETRRLQIVPHGARYAERSWVLELP